MKAQTAYQFFKSRAGFSYNPGVETPEQGRARCARELARAEMLGTDAGFVVEWMDDEDPDRSWMATDDYTDDDRESAEFYVCTVRDGSGKSVACLGGIHCDTRDRAGFRAYQRVVRAELFSEAMSARAVEGA